MDWDEHAATWDEREAVRAYASAAFDSLERRCQQLQFSLVGARACDFGCGTGLLSERLATKCSVVVAIDRSEAMISMLQAKVAQHGLDVIRPMAANLTDEFVASSPLLSDPFDVVACSSVCAFVDDYPATVASLARLLRPGGLFVQWDWELNAADDDPFGLTREMIRDAYQTAGLELVSVDTGFTIHDGEAEMSPLMGVGRTPG